MKILIKNGRVWNGQNFLYADILTENNIISKVQKDISENADYIFDASGMTVLPGLVDAHVHMKGISCDQFGINAEMSCMPFGVTAAVDAGGGLGDESLLGSFAVKSIVMPGISIVDNKPDFEAWEQTAKKYGERCVGIKLYFDIFVSEIKSIKPFMEIVDFAEEKNLPIMVHSSNPPVSMSELLSCMRKGDILTHAYHGGTNNVADDDFLCIAEAKKRGVIIDAGLAGNVHTDFDIFRRAIASGAIPDIISTDITRASAYKRGGKYGMTMCMSIARHLGISEEDIFRAVTSNPAKAFGKDSEWGYIAVGRCADIAVLQIADEGFDMTDKTGNRVCSESGYRCMLTVADGEAMYKF